MLLDDVVAGPAHVLGIVVGADVGDVSDGVAAPEDLVEAAGLVEVRGMQRETARGVGVHRLEEPDPRVVVDVADARSHLIAAIERLLHHMSAYKPRGTGHRHDAALLQCSHAVSL